MKKEFNVGDVVYIEPDRGICTGGFEKVTAIKVKKGRVIVCFGDHHFDAKTGRAITPPYAYYIAVRD